MMKKLTAILLMLTMLLSLGACTALKDVEGTEKLEPEETAPQAEIEEPVALEPEMDTALEALGNQVIVSLKKNVEVYQSPDGAGQTILTFSYDTATVHVEGNDAASERINTSLSVAEEVFYSGTGMGNGVSGMLEQATDNYTIAHELGDDRPLEFTSSRSATVRRSDSHVLSLVYETQDYTGGAHGIYSERAYVFNTETGERLTFSALCDSQEKTAGMKDYMLGKMVEQATAEGSGVDLSLFTEEGSLQAKLSGLMRDASWYLDESGLVVFSDVYEIGSYAAGIIRFRFSYEELADYLSERWLPTQREGDGSFSVAYVSDVPAGSAKILDRVAVDPEGTELCLTANGTIYDVTVVSVDYVNEGFYETAQHWNCSYMHDCSIQLVTILPEGMPNVMIRYTSADGSNHNLLITQSGEDGSLILTDDSITAVG